MAFRLGGGGAVTFRSAAPVARRDARLAAPLARLARVAVHPRAVALVRRDLRVSASFTETHARPRFPVSRHQGGGTKVPLTGALGDFASYFFLKTRRPSAVAARARASASRRVLSSAAFSSAIAANIASTETRSRSKPFSRSSI
jgi:hypothetical protein